MTKVVSYWKRSDPLPEPKHRCADIRFSKKVAVDDSPIACECSWSGLLAEWAAHAPRLSVNRAFTEAQHPWMRKPATRREPPCAAPDCERPVTARGYCKAHWSRLNRGASVDAPIAPARNRNGPYGYSGRP